MIAHVAEAGEDRGRIVLQLCAATPSAVALAAAISLAEAYQAEIEGVFVEDEQLLDLARFPFARIVPARGGMARLVTHSDMERELRHVATAVLHEVETLARAAGLTVRGRVMRAAPSAALATACAERGPWNLVVLADAFSPRDGHAIAGLLESALQATGIVIVGPKARRTDGPIIIALEEADRLSGMLHAADRLAAASEERIIVALIGEDEAAIHLLEAQLRLLLGERNDVIIVAAEIARGEPAVAAEALRRLAGGFVIAQFGRLVVPHTRDLTPIAAALECPLFLVR